MLSYPWTEACFSQNLDLQTWRERHALELETPCLAAVVRNQQATLPAIHPLTDTRRPAISTPCHYLALTTRYIIHITRQAVLKASAHLRKDRNYKCSPVVLADDVLLVLVNQQLFLTKLYHIGNVTLA